MFLVFKFFCGARGIKFIGLRVSRDEDLQGLGLIGAALDPKLF